MISVLELFIFKRLWSIHVLMVPVASSSRLMVVFSSLPALKDFFEGVVVGVTMEFFFRRNNVLHCTCVG